MHTLDEYRDGGVGFGLWVEDNVWLKVYPPGEVIPVWTPMNNLPTEEDQYGRSYQNMWEKQKEVMREALAMEGGRFKHTLVILCWQRGEGKSVLACLVELWKFFCWPSQQIALGANSKDQVKFVHYDIMRDIIRHSPNLFEIVGGDKNIQEKEIRLLDDVDHIASIIRSISSFTGIVSNITGYTFSEMFAMADPTFFVQLDGSIRNMPNALGVIDSTVSSKQHILYRLYSGRDKVTTLYFSYRCSKEGDPKDYWNPNMTQVQLNDYREKFPFGDFERYFLNLWSAGAERVFTDEMIAAWGYLGVDHLLGDQKRLLELLEKRNKIIEGARKVTEKMPGEIDVELVLDEIDRRLWPVSDVYTLGKNIPEMASLDDLERLGDLYDTDWVVGAGLDRADPMKTRTGARTIFSCVAKGLPGSRRNPFVYDAQNAVPYYIYLLLHLLDVSDHALESIKRLILGAHTEFISLEAFSGERWGAWDLVPWCDDYGIATDLIHPNYDRQKAAFTELFLAVKTGRFKAPPVLVPGSRLPDILKEEAALFDHDPDRKLFGSPEKKEKHGIQDDSLYSVAWCIYGIKDLGIDLMKPRRRMKGFGLFINPDGSLAGGLS